MIVPIRKLPYLLFSFSLFSGQLDLKEHQIISPNPEHLPMFSLHKQFKVKIKYGGKGNQQSVRLFVNKQYLQIKAVR